MYTVFLGVKDLLQMLKTSKHCLVSPDNLSFLVFPQSLASVDDNWWNWATACTLVWFICRGTWSNISYYYIIIIIMSVVKAWSLHCSKR